MTKPNRRRTAYLALGILAVSMAGAVVVWRVGMAPETVAIDYLDEEAVALGKGIYAEYCASCHGANLRGQANWRERKPDGRLPAPPQDETGHTWHHPDVQLFELTKYGPAALVEGSYQSDMPAFEEVLTDREVLASLAYIKSTWTEEMRGRHDGLNQRAQK